MDDTGTDTHGYLRTVGPIGKTDVNCSSVTVERLLCETSLCEKEKNGSRDGVRDDFQQER